MIQLHRLLKRQLERFNLMYEQPPKDVSMWQEFIAAINKNYNEEDQERYLLERSMEISSSEMIDINEQLEHAQELAKLCHWRLSSPFTRVRWSKSIYELLDLDPLNSPPTYSEFLALIQTEYRKKFKDNVEQSLVKKQDYDFEILLTTQEKQDKWFRIITSSKEMNELSGIIVDITETKKAELEIKRLNSNLVSTARLAGMSEVATIILHNVGNLLNSINVSIEILKQNLSIDSSDRLVSIVNFIQEHKLDLTAYIINDEKGKLILPYLEKFAFVMKNQYKMNSKEILRLEKNIHHIKEIVAVQQSISGISGVTENFSLEEVLKSAVEISNIHAANIDFKIDIKKNINTINTDKSRLIQILTNLLCNAKDAVLAMPENHSKKINIIVEKPDKKVIKIVVQDNGIGIPADKHKKIFSFGYSTKEKGHGFGLHSSSLAAKELGGSLGVKSKGTGEGAMFYLILPIQ